MHAGEGQGHPLCMRGRAGCGVGGEPHEQRGVRGRVCGVCGVSGAGGARARVWLAGVGDAFGFLRTKHAIRC